LSDHQRNKKIISEDLIKQFIAEYINLFDTTLVFYWHGGEPLLAVLLFFKKIIDFEEKYSRKDQKIYNNIQN